MLNLQPDPPVRSLLWGTSWTGLYVASNFVIKILRGLVIPYFLAPAGYGLWASVGVFLIYFRYADLGVQIQLAKRLPVILEQDGEDEFWNRAGLGLAWNLCIDAFLAICLLIASYRYTGDNADFYRSAFGMLAVVVVLKNLRALSTAVLNARQEFGAVAALGILANGVGFVAAVFGVIFFGPLGLVASLIIVEGVGLTYGLIRLAPMGIRRIGLHFRGLIATIREGGVLLLVYILETIMMTGDQVFLIRAYDKTEYGIYALGLFIVSTLIAVSAIFVTHQPRILALTAAGKKRESTTLVEANLILYIALVVVCIPFFLFMMDLLLRYYLTDYRVGVTLYALMPVMALARGPVVLLKGYFIACHRERDLIRWQSIGLAVIIVLNLIIVAFHGSLEWFVLSTTIGYAVSGWLMNRAFRLDHIEFGRTWSFMGWGILLMGITYALYLVLETYTLNSDAPLLGSLVTFGLVASAAITLLYMMRKTWASSLNLFLEGNITPALQTIRIWAKNFQ